MSDASDLPFSLGDEPGLLVVMRFAVPADRAESFAADARVALAVLAERVGFVDGVIAVSTDDAELRTITTRWTGIGAYRRALSHLDVKMQAIPFLSLAIDEPSAYEVVHERTPHGTTDTTSGLAADAGDIGLGSASGPDIPSVHA